MKSFCFINGRIIPSEDATIPISDLGLQRGYGVFDFGSTYNGKLFHFEDYLERFHQSASELKLIIPFSKNEIIDTAYQLLKISDLENPAVKLLITGGISDIDLSIKKPNFIISAENLSWFPKKLYVSGCKLITYNYQRELPHVKYLNYMNSIRLESFKKQKQADDILYYSDYGITESPRSNFFIFRGNTLVTPKDFVLIGITRKVILKLAKDKFNIEERPILINELQKADEAFLSSTRKKIMPVVKVDDYIIGNGKPGINTKILMKLFENYVRNYHLSTVS